MEMPAPVKRTAAPLANLLCDTSSYVLGVSNKDAPERCRSCRAKFCEAHRRLLEGVGSPAARAVLSFVESWDPASKECEELLAMADEGAVTGSTIALAYLDQGGEVVEVSKDPEVREAISRAAFDDGGEDGLVSLVSGRRVTAARIHPTVRGAVGALPTGASIVSCNSESCGHYGRSQGEVAPTAISSILPGRSRQSTHPGKPYGGAAPLVLRERGPHAETAHFQMHAALKNRCSFGPFIIAHQQPSTCSRFWRRGRAGARRSSPRSSSPTSGT